MIALKAGATRAAIAPEGAEMREWIVGDRPLLWQADPAVWSETAPLLFPVVGWTKAHQVRVDGKTYPLGLHGFARDREFRLVEQGDDYVRLVLESDAATRARYPFEFGLTVDYHLDSGMISVALGVENRGTAPMPYACGVHLGFRWPFAGGAPADYLVRFSEREDPFVPVIAPGGLISQTKRRLPLDDRVLRLAEVRGAEPCGHPRRERLSAFRALVPARQRLSVHRRMDRHQRSGRFLRRSFRQAIDARPAPRRERAARGALHLRRFAALITESDGLAGARKTDR